jgi:hypothetical protein
VKWKARARIDGGLHNTVKDYDITIATRTCRDDLQTWHAEHQVHRTEGWIVPLLAPLQASFRNLNSKIGPGNPSLHYPKGEHDDFSSA